MGTRSSTKMTALSSQVHIQSALTHLAYKRLPDELPFGSICLKRQENATVVAIIEITFRIRPDQVDWFYDFVKTLPFDGATTFALEPGRDPVLVRVKTSLHEVDSHDLSRYK